MTGFLDDTPGRPRFRGRWLLSGLAVVLVAASAMLVVTSVAWGETLREEQRLLPGTTIAGVDVGGETVETAREMIEPAISPRLERVVTLTHDDLRWATSPGELGATSDVDQLLAQAFDHTRDASVGELARMRWAGSASGIDLQVAVEVDEDAVAAFVTGIAEEVDRERRDATLSWDGEQIQVAEAYAGRQGDRDAGADALLGALDDRPAHVDVEVTTVDPDVTTEAAQRLADEVAAAIDAALDRAVTASVDEERWTVTPGELDATVDVEALLAAVSEGDAAPAEAAAHHLDVPAERLDGFVDGIAGEVDVAARDASMELVGGRPSVTPERDGLALDRDAAATAIAEALAGGDDQVELTVDPVGAAVTTASFDEALVLNQSERRLYLYRGGEVVRDWPVAVGQGGSPTPTGVFTVGHKRFEPTWHNPAPNGWGADMPASIGPGPDNPLGVRALNWNRGGQDTLIRFHGTPDEASIGQAASRGCVRMYNRDVIELYDLVDTGTTIVSLAG
jgi:lipoprotein-anchoring transpeptidase ErfK/SrfK